jgi:hypothetical protein
LPIDANKKVTLPNVPVSKLPEGVSFIVEGFYRYETIGKFYLTKSGSTYSDEVSPTAYDNTHLFRDKLSNLFYVSDGSEFVLLNGDYFAVTQTELNEILGIS